MTTEQDVAEFDILYQALIEAAQYAMRRKIDADEWPEICRDAWNEVVSSWTDADAENRAGRFRIPEEGDDDRANFVMAFLPIWEDGKLGWVKRE